jgi:hypothetical protein
MWSLTSPRVKRISGPEKFGSSAKKEFFNTICQKPTHPSQQMASLFDHFVRVRKDGLRDLRHLHCAVSSTRSLHCPQQKAIHGPITRRVDQQDLCGRFFSLRKGVIAG